MAEYTILSIDPGLTTCGYAYSIYDEDAFRVNAAGTIDTEDILRNHPEKLQYPANTLKSDILADRFQQLITTHTPQYVVSEAAFYNPSRPAAYASLLRCIFTLEHVLHAANIVLYKIAPALIKKESQSVAGAMADKNEMKDALMRLTETKDILLSEDVNTEELSEHAIDAIHVGKAFTKLWLPLLTAKLVPPRCTTYTKKLRMDIERTFMRMCLRSARCRVNFGKRKKK